MWQRKQTVFLVLAVVAVVACLLLPLLRVEPRLMGQATSLLYNAGISDGSHYELGLSSGLAVLLSLGGLFSTVAIFMYRNRRLQMALCSWAMLLMALWYVWLAVCIFTQPAADVRFGITFGVCLPIVAFILLLMARRGIKHDDDLVRSADRIR